MPTFYWACSKRWNTSTTWATCTGKVHLCAVMASVVPLLLTAAVCRSVKASHVLIAADGQVCMSGLRSIFSLIRHGQRARVVHDFPQYSVKVLPWLSPEVLQQVFHRRRRRHRSGMASQISTVSSLRTSRVMIPGRIFTASESQPVNWPTDTCPSRTCRRHR